MIYYQLNSHIDWFIFLEQPAMCLSTWNLTDILTMFIGMLKDFVCPVSSYFHETGFQLSRISECFSLSFPEFFLHIDISSLSQNVLPNITVS